jgi:hypothetical protein
MLGRNLKTTTINYLWKASEATGESFMQQHAEAASTRQPISMRMVPGTIPGS